MPYVDRNEKKEIICAYAVLQRKGQEFIAPDHPELIAFYDKYFKRPDYKPDFEAATNMSELKTVLKKMLFGEEITLVGHKTSRSGSRARRSRSKPR